MVVVALITRTLLVHSDSLTLHLTQTLAQQVDGTAALVVQTTGQTAAAAVAGMVVCRLGLQVLVVPDTHTQLHLGHQEDIHQQQHIN